IGCEEQRVRHQRAQRLQDEQFVIEIGAEDADRLDALRILLAQIAIELLYAVAEAPQVIELSLSFGSFLRLGIRRLGAGFGVLILRVATGLGTTAAGGRFAAGRLTIQTA